MIQSDDNSRFGRYLLLKRIARGGMAEIYRAAAYGEEGFAKRVAIKRMLPKLTKDPEFVDMFIAEAKLAAGLNHANIVQIHDFGCIDDRLYHAMEYVHGMNISELVIEMRKHGQPVPVGPACFIVCEAAYGLEHAHNHRDRQGRPLSIIHRDVSPSNIIVSFDGQVKIADFGIAKASWVRRETRTGVIKGKFKYMSPEQARGKRLDQRTDLFSLGVCLFKMLTLRDVYNGKSEQTLLMQAREGKIETVRKHNPVVSEKLEAILAKVMHPDREQRYPDATSFRDALENFLFANKLQMFPSSLARYMRDGFGHIMGEDQLELASEAEQTARSQPKASTMAEMRAADEEEISTMIIDRMQLDVKDLPSLDDDDDEESATAIETMPERCRPTAPMLPRAEMPALEAPKMEDLPAFDDDETVSGTGAAPLVWGAESDWDDETEAEEPRLARRAKGPTTEPTMPSMRPSKAAKPEPGRPLEQRRTRPVMPAAQKPPDEDDPD